MNRSLNRILARTLVAACALVGSQVFAGSTVYVQENSSASFESLNLVLPIQSGAHNYDAGSLNITVGASLHEGSISHGTSFLAYCIDPFQWSSSSPTAYTLESLSTLGSGRESDVTRLYSQSYAGTNGNSLNSAAFQLALWELAKDDGVLTTGKVHTTDATDAAVMSAANSMIYNAQHGGAGSGQYSFDLYTNGSNQDYLVATMASVTPVPEPETYAMLLAGLGLIGFTAKRRRISA